MITDEMAATNNLKKLKKVKYMRIWSRSVGSLTLISTDNTKPDKIAKGSRQAKLSPMIAAG